MTTRAARRHRFIMAAAVLIIATAAVIYGSMAYDWLRGAAPAAPAARPERDDASLGKARAAFRERYLSPAAHLRLSEALFDAGRPVDAFYVMHWARSFFGEESFGRAHAAVVLYKGRHFLGAAPFDASPKNEAALKARLQRAPQDAALLDYLAHIAASRGQAKEAAALVAMGLAAHPDDPGLLSYQGQLAGAAGDARAAVTAWARLAAAAPDAFETQAALEELGRRALRKTAEDGRLAAEALDELAKARPDDPRVFSTWAMSFWGRGELSAARAVVEEALSKRPGHAGALMVEGALALADRDVDKAVRLLTAAWEKNPADLYSAAKLAQLYYQTRADREAALPYYIALYRFNPRFDDGEPAERRIRETLDLRREARLKPVPCEALGRFLSADDASLRAEAAAKAAACRDPRWIETLADLLDDDAEIVRHNADYALFQIAKAAPDAVRVRRDEWLQSDKLLLRGRALNLFADLEPKETFPLVKRALSDPSAAVRFLAKVMVLDHYYRGVPEADKARAEYLAREKDPEALALYAALGS